VRASSIDLRLNTAATAALAREISPDVVIAALGAKPVVPRIPGIERAVGAEEIYVDTAKAGENVMILGGGLVGVELGIFLAEQAGYRRKVTILEMLPALSDGGNNLQALALDVKIRELGVTLALSTKALEIRENGVLAETSDGAQTLFEADTVIYAVGQRPLWDDADALRACAPEFHQLGDCLAPKNIREATRAAFFAASNIGRA
jgi:pyruvate/2-oxoglutarate dehydrogenase complex dihydrolipoamide dehydrogenase (E3) component